MATIGALQAGGHNMLAFLDTIAFSELGELILKRSDDGYNVIVGSTPTKLILTDHYADHPNRLIELPNLGIKSTAAGRYQILYRFWKVYKIDLSLKDFGKVSQDRVALQLIKECKATEAIATGNIREAVRRCKSRWASLPGAGYGQHEHKIENLLAYYVAAGGKLAKGQ